MGRGWRARTVLFSVFEDLFIEPDTSLELKILTAISSSILSLKELIIRVTSSSVYAVVIIVLTFI